MFSRAQLTNSPTFALVRLWQPARNSTNPDLVTATPQPPAEPAAATPHSAVLDVQLVERMTRGEKEALGRLYERHSHLVFSAARRFLGERTAVEDLTHDVFLEAWRRCRNYAAERGSVRSWLLTITRSRALDRLQSQKNRARKLAVQGPEPDVSEEEGSRAVEQQRLRETLLEMSPNELEVLLLGYFEGLSSTEIAMELEIPVGTVKSRTRSALAHLKVRLKETA